LNISEKSDQYNKEIVETIQIAISEFISTRGVEPTLSQRKHLEAAAWASVYGEE
jgi:hypothetical protein